MVKPERGLVRPDERIVVLVSGSGMKDVASAMKSVEQVGTRAHRVAPELEDVKLVINEALSRKTGQPD
jgi:hypothetical protein